MIRTMRVGWAGKVARMGKKWNEYGILEERQKERDHWEEQDLGG
jgi:hypothetical protein